MTTNSICDLFGIRYPILQGGMLWIANAELAAAVSNAGALGVLSPYAGMDENGDSLQNFLLQIDRMRQLTQKPFGANIPLDLPESGLFIDILLRNNLEIAVTAAGNPALYTELLHSAGIRVAHVVSSAAQAGIAEAAGVDAVVAAGVEAGGRLGREAQSLASLLPQVASAVSIPVIAAGGIANRRGMAAAFRLGADGVQLGTRFIATEECIAHRNYKLAILAAGDADTIVTCRGGVSTRSLRSAFTQQLAAMENSGAPAEVIRGFIGRGRSRQAQLEGNLDEGDAFAGTSAELIQDILPAAVVVENLVKNWNP